MELEACSCEYEGEPSEFFVEKLVKARKPHTCCECHDAIQPGETYQRITGMWDGQIDTYKTCLPCSRIRADYAPCSCFEFLDDEIAETLGVHLDGSLSFKGMQDEEWEKED